MPEIFRKITAGDVKTMWSLGWVDIKGREGSGAEVGNTAARELGTSGEGRA